MFKVCRPAWQKRLIYNCFIDFQRKFDTMKQDMISAVLKSLGLESKIATLLQNIYKTSKAAVRVGVEFG
jgi:hypothetical protein